MGRATNRSVRFTGGKVSRQGFWRHWGGWGDRSPRSLGSACWRSATASRFVNHPFSLAFLKGFPKVAMAY